MIIKKENIQEAAYEKKKDRYPIIHPKFSRDFAFHFAVGYPF